MSKYLLIFASLLFMASCGGGESSTNGQSQNTTEETPNVIEENPTSNLSEEDKTRFTSGENLFSIHCASCHKIKEDLIGPALAGITERRSMEWIIKFTKNSKEMIESGDKEAVAVYEKYNKTVMQSFENLSDEEIENIIFYIEASGKTP